MFAVIVLTGRMFPVPSWTWKVGRSRLQKKIKVKRQAGQWEEAQTVEAGSVPKAART